MTVLIPRARTIGVRLSAEEYSALERFSFETGARSISDVARAAICKFVRKPARESLTSAVEHATQLRDLEQRVSQLHAEIALLKTDQAQHISETKKVIAPSQAGVPIKRNRLFQTRSSDDNDLVTESAINGAVAKLSAS